MRHDRLMIAGVILAVALSAVSVALQIGKEISPFDKYRQSTANEFALRLILFEVGALQQRVPYSNGTLAPAVQTLDDQPVFTEGGKLVIQVQVSSEQLPRTVEARKQAMLEAVGIARAGFARAFGLTHIDFDRWTRVEFFDIDTLLKSTAKKPLDPVIGVYENGDLVLR